MIFKHWHWQSATEVQLSPTMNTSGLCIVATFAAFPIFIIIHAPILKRSEAIFSASFNAGSWCFSWFRGSLGDGVWVCGIITFAVDGGIVSVLRDGASCNFGSFLSRFISLLCYCCGIVLSWLLWNCNVCCGIVSVLHNGASCCAIYSLQVLWNCNVCCGIVSALSDGASCNLELPFKKILL